MKDSRTGAFGVMAIAVFLILKWALILQTLRADSLSFLLIAPAASRWMVMNFILLFPPARSDGMGAFLKSRARAAEPAAAGVFTIGISLLLGGIPAAAACAAALLLLAGAAAIISRMLGGLTGDVYGSLIESAEALLLMLLPAAAGIAGDQIFTGVPGL